MTNSVIDNWEEITKVNWCKIFRKVWTKKSNDVKKSRSRERNSFHWGVVAITRMRFTIRPGRRGFARRPSVFGGTLDALKWPHPRLAICIAIRNTPTHAARARARMLHSAGLNVPRLYSDPEFFFPRVRSVPPRSRTQRFLVPFFLPPMEMTPPKNGTQPGETRGIASIPSFFSFFFFLIHEEGNFIEGKCVHAEWLWSFDVLLSSNACISINRGD